jgi:putative transport protein
MKRVTRSGLTLGSLAKDLPSGMQVTMVRKGHTNLLPADDLVLSGGDAILVVAETQADIQQAGARLGSVEPGRLAKDRSAVDYIRVFGTIHCS